MSIANHPKKTCMAKMIGENFHDLLLRQKVKSKQLHLLMSATSRQLVPSRWPLLTQRHVSLNLCSKRIWRRLEAVFHFRTCPLPAVQGGSEVTPVLSSLHGKESGSCGDAMYDKRQHRSEVIFVFDNLNQRGAKTSETVRSYKIDFLI